MSDQEQEKGFSTKKPITTIKMTKTASTSRTVVTRNKSMEMNTKKNETRKKEHRSDIANENAIKTNVGQSCFCLACKQEINYDLSKVIACDNCKLSLHVECCMTGEIYQLFLSILKEEKNNEFIFGKISYQCKECLISVASKQKQQEEILNVGENSNLQEDTLIVVNGDGKNLPTKTTEVQNNIAPKLSTKPTCYFYRKGSCKYGSSGKKEVDGKVCQYSHPKKCSKYCKFGSNHINGCRDSTCKLLHPYLCTDSYQFGECKNSYCTYQHRKGTIRTENLSKQFMFQNKNAFNGNTIGRNVFHSRNDGLRQSNSNGYQSRPYYKPNHYHQGYNFQERSGTYNKLDSNSNLEPKYNPTSKVEQSLTEILDSINNLQMKNEQIEQKLSVLESNAVTSHGNEIGLNLGERNAQNNSSKYNWTNQMSRQQNDFYGEQHQPQYSKNYPPFPQPSQLR